jgi:hypothetical protein
MYGIPLIFVTGIVVSLVTSQTPLMSRTTGTGHEDAGAVMATRKRDRA